MRQRKNSQSRKVVTRIILCNRFKFEIDLKTLFGKFTHQPARVAIACKILL